MQLKGQKSGKICIYQKKIVTLRAERIWDVFFVNETEK